MQAYRTFAQVYDNFMQDVNYDEWGKYILELLRKYNGKKSLGLDLGCGTGKITEFLAKQKVDMIGVDLSCDMLAVAKETAKDQGLDILYLEQDMTEFELYGTVDFIVSICDSINYLLEKQELLKTFKLVNNYLDPKGIFIFDMNTKHKYQNILAENTFAETLEDSCYIWNNYFYEDDNINEYELTFFMKKEGKDSYERFEEIHYQKAYSINLIKELLQKAGLDVLAVYDAFTFNEPKEDSERVYFVAQEISKKRNIMN